MKLGPFTGTVLVLALLVLPALVPWAIASSDEATRHGPRMGDLVRYALLRGGSEEPVGSYAFGWTERTMMRDAFGVPRLVDVVTATRIVDDERWDELFVFHADTPVLLSVTVEQPGHRTEFEPLVATDVWHTYRATRYASGSPWACLARAAWHAEPGMDLHGRAVHDACPGADAPHARGARFHRASAPAGVGARTFTATGSGSAWSVTLHPGVPYPLRAVLPHGDDVLTLRLDGLARGDAAHTTRLDREAPVPPVQRPGATPGRVDEWGLPQGDADAFPFPPNDALRHLLTDPWREDVRAYLRDHPDARVVAYAFFENRHTWDGHAGAWPTWRFVFNDPHGHGFVAHARRAPVVDVARLPASALADALPRAGEGERVHLPPLDVDALPRSSVSLSDAVTAWRNAQGRDAPFNRVDVVLQDGLPGGSRLVEPRPGREIVIGFVEYDAGVQPTASAAARYETRTDRTAARVDLATGRLVDVTSVGVDRARVPDVTHDAASVPAFAPPAVPADRVPGFVTGTMGLTLAVLLAHALRVLGGAFYSRVEPGDVLAHGTRERLLRLLEQSPGLHARALARAADLERGTARYHLRVLVRAGYVTALRKGGFVRYWPAGAHEEDAAGRDALLRSGCHARVLALVTGTDGLSQREIADRLRLTPPAVHYAVRRLERAGLVERQREGREMRVRAVRREASPRGPVRQA